ncbi:AurF N-oxygenase family protein [Rhodococcoides kyotonense]|uniref:p-aminobenzoate N-oxygenase AurF n=1 Tax=Rhodococcoides kyotonense TaxID=398843 RepID=A0A239IL75_9NOCA|nr:diiron oxygenase [Rhodococcus kyotonensis]SNS93978.1 P-aminobenzoate N-oxygenase AurF [Rhodococcus kyotonensis]
MVTVTPSKNRLPVEAYREMLDVLSEGSVRRNFDPYLDIDWDSDEFQMTSDDPRWVLPEYHPLGGTGWYRNLPRARQIEVGHHIQINAVKVGAAFESILIRGMMQFIVAMPNNSLEFRYCLHEITEECNHIQMFQELVNRSGADVPGMRKDFRLASPYIGMLGASLPLIFFVGILAGEEPIDHWQKEVIRQGDEVPPAMLRTMEIHIAEEARHISFAHHFLRQHYPNQSRFTKWLVAVSTPVIMRWLAGVIMAPPRKLASDLGIPRAVVKEAYWDGPVGSDQLQSYFGDVRMLASELGMMNRVSRYLWKKLRIDGPVSRFRGEPDRSVRD